ncbi:retinol dehydrogenase 12-like isoform X2 [Diabrotica undecimpunctata]|uniref:retinol dehydrogenase 12-like isoform X2 n=1 Tax=Diabrotica undecimpunctata TaxID=50387 RepID=UPI003B6376BD
MGSLLAVPCTSKARLDGKTAVITGANTGIGKITAKDFYKRGATVIIACRNLDKANEAIQEIKQDCQGQENLGQLKSIKLDLSSLQSVRACAEELNKAEHNINLLVNNAGVMAVPFSKTVDGFELTFGTNHLGHYLLTILLLPKIIQSGPGARIVNVSSLLHQNHGIDGVNVYALHPGVIKTELTRSMNESMFPGARFILSDVVGGIFFKTPEQGAQTQIHCSVDEKCADQSGLYYSECKPVQPSKVALNDEMAAKMWDVSWKLVGLEENYDPFRHVVNSGI